MKVPDFTGRVAAISAFAVAIASFYLLDGAPAEWQSAGSKLALAGGAVVIGLLKVYRSSMKDRDEVPLDQLAAASRSKLAILKFLNALLISSAGLSLIVYIFTTNQHRPLFGVSPFIWAACAIVSGLFREIVSGLRSTPEFVR